MLRLGRWRSIRPERSIGSGANAHHPRLERLVLYTRAILLFERIWRLLVPPLIVVGVFVCVSWTGLWLETPRWARALGLSTLVLSLIISLWPLLRFRFPSRQDALARIDRVSGLAAHPAAVMDDKLANGGNDPATLALWNLHRKRAESALALLRTGGPSPRIVELDRFALRASVLVALIATGFAAGPERHARLAAAFDWRFDTSSLAGTRVDAWIDPPAYTGKPPLVLNLGGNKSLIRASNPQHIEAPSHSIVVIHTSGGHVDMDIKGALEKEKKEDAAPSAGPAASTAAARGPAREGDIRLVLQGDAALTLSRSGTELGSFEIHAIADQAPSIALTAAPKVNARGSLTLKYHVADDYGVASAEAQFAKPVLPGGRLARRSLVEPPRAALQLPLAPDTTGDAETTADLSGHPWAGARVEMSLMARDAGGNEGKSAPVEITLPQKPFVKPLARALAEQRRNLVLAPDDKARVATALDALMIAPDIFGTSPGIYLGLRVASGQISAARSDGDLAAVADFLWEMAQQIENGDLSDAERELRAAEQDLREALQRSAPEDEIRKLSENLRAAMNRFLQELAARQKNESGQNQSAAMNGRVRWIKPEDLEKMLDKLQEMLRSGDMASARIMLEQLQNILENLQMAQPRQANPKDQAMSHALDELGRLSQDQQTLRDDTYQDGQGERHRQREEHSGQSLSDEPTLEEFFGHDSGGVGADNNGGGKTSRQRDFTPKSGKAPQAGQKSDGSLAKRQQALREQLETLQRRLNEAGADTSDLDGANTAMREAEKALGQGPEGTNEAVDAQGRAVEALREGAQKLAEAMQAQPGGDGSGEAATGQGQFGTGDETDPLGRPTGGERAFNPSARFDPMGIPAMERARRVLEELRRRLGEPARPREEMDYLERLLRR